MGSIMSSQSSAAARAMQARRTSNMELIVLGCVCVLQQVRGAFDGSNVAAKVGSER